MQKGKKKILWLWWVQACELSEEKRQLGGAPQKKSRMGRQLDLFLCPEDFIRVGGRFANLHLYLTKLTSVFLYIFITHAFLAGRYSPFLFLLVHLHRSL